MIKLRNLIIYGKEVHATIVNKRIIRTQDIEKSIYDKKWNTPILFTKWTKYVTDIVKDSLIDIEYNSILEIGCGVGSNLRMLNDRSKYYYGLDISSTGINYAES